jgi:hypothetical protein
MHISRAMDNHVPIERAIKLHVLNMPKFDPQRNYSLVKEKVHLAKLKLDFKLQNVAQVLHDWVWAWYSISVYLTKV